MKTLIPVLLVIFVISSAKAQDASYAVNLKANTSSSYSAGGSEMNDPVIKVKVRTDRKVLLNWNPFQGAVSHYVLERSTDAHTYQEAGVFFTGDWSSESQYFYMDVLKKSYAGPLYYRLRVVGLDGSVIYTPVTALDPAQRM